ncbi:hypothetical protein MASB_27970 [Mycobacteroides abscessus subsp. bolletii BD]|nr:hypothetical protein MASB_27970 [Mycobacteroides abscessus subsp. bolletii BD]
MVDAGSGGDHPQYGDGGEGGDSVLAVSAGQKGFVGAVDHREEPDKFWADQQQQRERDLGQAGLRAGYGHREQVLHGGFGGELGGRDEDQYSIAMAGGEPGA